MRFAWCGMSLRTCQLGRSAANDVPQGDYAIAEPGGLEQAPHKTREQKERDKGEMNGAMHIFSLM